MLESFKKEIYIALHFRKITLGIAGGGERVWWIQDPKTRFKEGRLIKSSWKNRGHEV